MTSRDLPTAVLSLAAAIESDVPTVEPDSPLVDAIALLSQKHHQESCLSLCPSLSEARSSDAWPSEAQRSEAQRSETWLSKSASSTEPGAANCLLVVEGTQLVGLLSDREWSPFVKGRLNLDELTVADVMIRDPVVLRLPDLQDVAAVLALFRQHRLHYLPVLDEQDCVLGAISLERLSEIVYIAVETLQQNCCQQAERIAVLETELEAEKERLSCDRNSSATGNEAELYQAIQAKLHDPHFIDAALKRRNQELETQLQERTDQLMNLNEELLHEIAERHRAETALRESEIRYRAIVEDQTELVCRFLPDGTLTFANESYCHYFGQSLAELIGQNCLAFLSDTDRRKELQQLSGLSADNPTRSMERAIARPDGTVRWQHWIDRAILNGDGKIVEFQSVGRDITARKQAEAALQEANATLKGWVNELEQRNEEMALLGEMSDFLQACLTVEEAYSALASLVQPLFPGTAGGVFAINNSNTLVEVMATWGDSPPIQPLFASNDCWALRRGRLHWAHQTQSGLMCQHVHRNTLPLESLCVPMMAQGKALGLLYLSAQTTGCLSEAKQRLAVTVTEHIALALANLKLREKLHSQSVRDPLTGLFNRRYLEESLEREIQRAKRKQQPLGIIMIDIDRFKHFNDTFGHEAGDTVLRALGIFLQRSVRASDIACRYGGEELLLILPDASLTVATQRAEQLRQNIKQINLKHQDQTLGSITISLGVACFPDHGCAEETLIQAADAALYRAKKAGRDCVAIAQ